MADTTLNRFVGEGDDAQEAAFTPSPPTPASGPDAACLFVNKEDPTQPDLKWWDGANFIAVGGGGANAVTAAGTLTSGQPVLGGGAKAVAVGPINLAGGASFVTGDLPLANLAQGSALSVLGVTGNATADNASIAAASDHQVFRRSGTAVSFGAVNLAQSAAVTGTLPAGNGGTGVAAGFVPLLRGSLALTDAQVKALPTTGINIVAAPGAGFYLNVIAVELLSKFTSGAYTNVNTTYSVLTVAINGQSYSANIVNDSAVTPTAYTALTTFLGASAKRARLPMYLESQGGYVEPFTVNGTFGIDTTASLENQPVSIAADNNGSGNYTGGNAANTLTVKVYYTVEAMP